MIYEAEIKLLRKILQMTKDRILVWKENYDSWFNAEIKVDGDCDVISFRFLYYRVTTHQNCVTPGMAEVFLHGGPRKFAVGTEGFALCQEIFEQATWDNKDGLDLFNDFLQKPKALENI